LLVSLFYPGSGVRTKFWEQRCLNRPWGSGVILYVIGLLTALMTAFYHERMMWKTFYTNHDLWMASLKRMINGHVCSSPLPMTVRVLPSSMLGAASSSPIHKSWFRVERLHIMRFM